MSCITTVYCILSSSEQYSFTSIPSKQLISFKVGLLHGILLFSLGFMPGVSENSDVFRTIIARANASRLAKECCLTNAGIKNVRCSSDTRTKRKGKEVRLVLGFVINTLCKNVKPLINGLRPYVFQQQISKHLQPKSS